MFSCSDDDDDTLGVWYRRSDFDGVARTDAAGFTIGNVGYLCTGYRGSTKDRLKDCWAYDIEANSWTQCTSMPDAAPARNAATGFAVGTKGYIATGYDATKKDYLNDCWQYDPATNSWKEMASIPDGTDGTNIYGKRYYALSFGIGQYGYLGTGYNDNYQKDFWKFDPSVGDKGEWTAMSGFGGQKRMGGMAFVIDDIAYICGGENNGSDVTDFWCFNPATGTWKELRELYDKSDDDYDDDYEDDYDDYDDRRRSRYDDDDDYDDRRRSRYDDDDDYDDRRKDRYDDRNRRKKNEVNKDTKKIMKILMVVAGVVIALLIMFLVGNAVGVFKGGKGTTTQQTDSEMVKVPDVTGKTYEEAQKELNKYDLGIHKSTAPSDTVEKGKIISQDPADGKKVKKHTTVNVVISSGEEAKMTTIPNVVGMSEANAEKALQAKNLVVKKGDPVYSDDVEQGEVVSVSPSEGAEVKEGTTVTLVISKGNQPATVPKLTGKSQSDAEAALSQAGLSGNATEDYSDTVEKGLVISQDTDAGKEVSKGTTIGYVVSKGPKMTVVTVPDLSYKDQNTAEKLLKQAGLTPEYIGEDYSDEYPEGQVFYQSVSSGTQVEKGTTVQYMVSKGSQPSDPDSGDSGNDSGTEENTNQ